MTTKWKRLEFVLIKYQTKDASGKVVVKVLEALFDPVNYIGKQSEFKLAVNDVNKILVTAGYEIDSSGKMVQVQSTSKLDEISARYSSLLEKLRDLSVHKEVLKYCTKELVQENYFHSVFEAAKGLSERVRELSDLEADGSRLFDAVFSIGNPILKFNSLANESEKNQQNGLKEMMHGITHYIRNVTAHEPKIKWTIDEVEAINVLMILSFLHKSLDICEEVVA